MADVAFNGISEQIVSFISKSVEIGDLVLVSTPGTVVKAGADREIVGKCVTKNGDVVGILIHGALEVMYTGSTPPPLGVVGLATGGNNMIKPASAGNKYLVVGVDTSTKKVTILL